MLSCTNTRCWAAAKSDKAAFHTAGSHPAEKAIKAYRGSLLMAHARSYTCLPPNASEHWQYCCIICNTQVHQSRSRSAYTRQSTERTHTGRVSPAKHSPPESGDCCSIIPVGKMTRRSYTTRTPPTWKMRRKSRLRIQLTFAKSRGKLAASSGLRAMRIGCCVALLVEATAARVLSTGTPGKNALAPDSTLQSTREVFMFPGAFSCRILVRGVGVDSRETIGDGNPHITRLACYIPPKSAVFSPRPLSASTFPTQLSAAVLFSRV